VNYPFNYRDLPERTLRLIQYIKFFQISYFRSNALYGFGMWVNYLFKEGNCQPLQSGRQFEGKSMREKRTQ